MTVTRSRNRTKHSTKHQTEISPEFWNQLVRGPPKRIESNFAESTKLGLNIMRANFEQFSALLEPKDSKYWLENLDINVVEGFLRWYLETHNVEHQSGFLIRARYWRIYYCEKMQKGFPYSLKEDMKSLVCQNLTEEYGLIKTSKFQRSVDVDDLLYLVHHLMATSDEYFPTLRQRQQHNTLRNMMMRRCPCVTELAVSASRDDTEVKTGSLDNSSGRICKKEQGSN